MSDSKKDKILDHIEFLEKNLGQFKDSEKTLLKQAISDSKGMSETELTYFMQLPEVVSATSFLKGPQAAKSIYSQIGVDTSNLNFAVTSVDMTDAAARMSMALAKGDNAEAMKIAKEMAVGSRDSDGNLNTGMIAGAVALIAKFVLGSKTGDTAKYSALAALGTMAWNWYNSGDGKETIAGLTGGLGEGAGGLMGGLSSLLSGGAEGATGILGTLGETLGSLGEDDSLGGLMKGAMNMIKDQPLVAAAIGYGLHKMFKNGLSFGGVFSGLPSLAMGLAVAWVASSVLGIGDNKNQGIIADRSDEVSAGQLASQNAAPSRSPQVAS